VKKYWELTNTVGKLNAWEAMQISSWRGLWDDEFGVSLQLTARKAKELTRENIFMGKNSMPSVQCLAIVFVLFETNDGWQWKIGQNIDLQLARFSMPCP